MLKIAYGEASFDNLRSGGAVYVDKTHYIPLLENHKKFFFIRPRRFGKSLWVSVLQAYYDIAKKDKFDRLFDGLYIQKNPTEYKSTYLILKLDFSGISTENEESLRKSFSHRVRSEIYRFLRNYKEYYSEGLFSKFEAKMENMLPSEMILDLRNETALTDKKLYVFIDEYDHFANKLASEGRETFIRDIMSRSGFVREFYEQMKIASGEGVIERFFITGVSPIMLDELSSGFNILSDMTTDARFNEMLGFTNEEVKSLMNRISEERYRDKSREDVLQDMIHYYNGYRFSDEASVKVFNSDMVLYFLEKFSGSAYPKDLLDENVKTDYSKLRGLIVGTGGKDKLQSIIEEINLNNSLELSLVKRFNFTQRFSDNELKSLLFYLGLLTFSDSPNQFSIPNHVIRTLYWEYLRRFLEESLTIELDVRLLNRAVNGMAVSGDPSALKEMAVDFFQKKLSSYDYTHFSEKHVKFLFICYFTLSQLYNIISERELPERKRIDLLFEAHPAYYHYVKYNFIIEFKYIRKEDSPSEAAAKREQAVKQAAEYYEIYRRDFKQFGRELRSAALIVSHTKDVELIEVGGFGVE